ncbi:MAG: AAA family ATPase [Phycisphaerales bacterium]|nr:AAA family ATPase [Phycisphaerales bacterium]
MYSNSDTHPSQHTQTHAQTPGRAERESRTDRPDAPARNPHTRPTVERIRDRLVANLGANRVRRYLSGSVRLTQNGSGLVVSATDSFTLDMIERRVGADLRRALGEELGVKDASVAFTLRDPEPTPENGASNAPRPAGPARLSTPINAPRPSAPRTPRCPSLDGFILGSSNRVAFEAVRRVIEDSAQTLPTFLHGSCGVGKTHLLRGAAERFRRVHPGARVRYTTGESFTNEYAGSVRTNTVEAFKKKYRKLDLLCIDDIHLMAGKGGTQTELLQVFNTLSLGGARIILASDEHPREIKRFNDALVSRFASGVVVRIDEPDAELARKLIVHNAAKSGLRLDDTGIATIMQRVGVGQGATARDIEGAITQICAVSRLMDDDPTQAGTIEIQRAMDLRSPSARSSAPTGPIAMGTIIGVVCESLAVTRSDLGGRGRQKKVVLARELCVHLAKNLTTRSTPEIAHAIGRPNHSTIITAANRIKGKIEDGAIVDVCCSHDGVPIGELYESLKTRVLSQRAG